MAKQIMFDIVARDKASKTFSKIGGAAKLLGIVGLGGIVANAVQTEAAFGKTMNLMQAGSGASGKEMEKLRALAVKMGADTQFSAGQAAEAMLELSKGGISPAAIQAGALQGTLTLAAAGGLEMASAATIAGNALNTFGLQAKDMNSVAAALAGGANASTASVESMGQALQQVGPGAKTAGLSIQETTAVLAAFDNAGIKGSDAGTSLKTMLTRLVPTTDKAKNAMADLGLKFTDANGKFKSISNISEQLRKKMGKLSDAERTKAMNTIFGSDATRAATVLMGEGAKGVNKLIKATSDQGAAQKMANASMKGTGGALERMKGSLETASLAIGQMLAPAVVFLADKVGMAANAFVAFTPKLQAAAGFVKNNQTAFMALGATIAALIVVTKIHAGVVAIQQAGGLLSALKSTKLVTSAMKVAAAVQWLWTAAMNVGNTTLATRIGVMYLDAAAWVRSTVATVAHTVATVAHTVATVASSAAMLVAKAALLVWAGVTKAAAAAQWLLNAALIANPIGIVIVAIAALIAIVVLVATKTNFFQNLWKKAWGGIKTAFWAVFGFIKKNWPMILPILFGPIGAAALLIIKKWDSIKSGASGVVDFVKSIPGKLRDLGGKFGDAGSFLIGKFLGGLRKVGGVIADIAGDIWGFIKGFFNSAIGKINDAIPDKIALKGMPDLNLPDNPFPTFARGGFPRAGWGLVGERGPELVRFGGGERVFSNRDSARMGGGGGGGININISGALDPVAVGRQVEQVLITYQRSISRPLQITTT